jgi:polygalacturonase
MWLLHPLYSENVSVRDVSFISTGPNGDGVDVDSCKDVRISDCFFSTGDDCIVIKSGRDADGRRTARPTEHVAITNCVMYKGHGAVVIGSETSGDIRDVVASNVVACGTDRGIRIKSMIGRGGVIENMRFDNFVVEDAKVVAIEITALYHNVPDEPFSERTPVFRNLSFSNLTIVNAKQVASIEGLAQKPIERLRFTDVVASGSAGFLCSFASNVDLLGVQVDAKSGKPFVLNHVRDMKIDGVPQPPAP